MPRSNAPQLNSTLQYTLTGGVRPFVQFFGTPDDTAEYYGRMNISDAFGQSRADADIIYVPSDVQRNEFVKIGEITRALENSSVSFTQLVDQDLSTLWDDMLRNNTTFYLHLLIGDDTIAPQDFGSWRSKFVLSYSKITEVTRGENSNPQSPDENGTLIINGTVTFWDVYPVGTVKFSQLGATPITKNLLDATLVATSDRRTSEVFGITTNAAATTPSAVVYGRVNSDSTFTQTDITALSTDGLLAACDVAGSYFIGIRNDGTESYLYSTLADIREANDNFTEVTTGFTASSGGNDLYVLNVANIFIAADGGYVYKIPKVGSGVVTLHSGGLTSQNLNSIDGFGSQIVAVGASSAIIYSDDNGQTWNTGTAPTAGLTINTVSVVGKNRWWIGTSAGALYYTLDGGTNWTQVTLIGSPTAIVDIEFFGETDAMFGFIAANDGSNALLYRTTDGGNTWNNSTPDISRFSTTFTGVAAPTSLSVLNQNELIVTGDDVLGYAING